MAIRGCLRLLQQLRGGLCASLTPSCVTSYRWKASIARISSLRCNPPAPSGVLRRVCFITCRFGEVCRHQCSVYRRRHYLLPPPRSLLMLIFPGTQSSLAPSSLSVHLSVDLILPTSEPTSSLLRRFVSSCGELRNFSTPLYLLFLTCLVQCFYLRRFQWIHVEKTLTLGQRLEESSFSAPAGLRRSPLWCLSSFTTLLIFTVVQAQVPFPVADFLP